MTIIDSPNLHALEHRKWPEQILLLPTNITKRNYALVIRDWSDGRVIMICVREESKSGITYFIGSDGDDDTRKIKKKK